MSPVTVTVAIPTYNRPGFLQRALRCVQAQTLAPLEIIVLDNASEDTTWRELPELADPLVRVISHPSNIGVMNNWNKAIEEARGDAICIFHDDDVMYPRFVEVTAGLLDRFPEAGMAFTRVRRVDCMGMSLGIWWETEHEGPIAGSDYVLWCVRRFGTLALPSAVVYRMSTCKAIGGFGGSLSTSAFDAEYFLRVAMHGDVVFANELLSDYTLHPHQISEEFWRRDRPSGQTDACLEIMNAGCWLLGRETIADDTRREVAQVMSKATALMAHCVRQRTGTAATF